MTPRLLLRPPTLRDVESWYRILSDPAVTKWMVPEVPWTRARVRAKVRAAQRAARTGEACELAVVVRRSGEVIGRVALKHIVGGLERNATLAYWTAPAAWGEGYTSEAVRALIGAGHRQLRLHRIDADVLAFNRRSARLLESVGFRREGEKREAFQHRGRWISLRVYGLLPGELRAVTSGRRGARRERANRRTLAR